MGWSSFCSNASYTSVRLQWHKWLCTQNCFCPGFCQFQCYTSKVLIYSFAGKKSDSACLTFSLCLLKLICCLFLFLFLFLFCLLSNQLVRNHRYHWCAIDSIVQYPCVFGCTGSDFLTWSHAACWFEHWWGDINEDCPILENISKWL